MLIGSIKEEGGNNNNNNSNNDDDDDNDDNDERQYQVHLRFYSISETPREQPTMMREEKTEESKEEPMSFCLIEEKACQEKIENRTRKEEREGWRKEKEIFLWFVA
jgi:hypothetical protein